MIQCSFGFVHRRLFWVITSIAFLVTSIMAQQIPPRPNPPKLVNDFASVLTSEQAAQLEQRLREFEDQTSNQIVFVSVPTLDGSDAAMYAYELGQQWGVGQKGFDNGVVFLFKNKSANEKGQVFIATGYGLEEKLPDALAKRIVEIDILPRFREGDVYGGITAGVDGITKLTSGALSAEELAKWKKEHAPKAGRRVNLPLILFLAFIVFSIFGSGRRGRTIGGGGLATNLLLASMLTSSRGRSYSDFSSGGGSFGGFGGGGFGGGGSGGSW